MYLLICFRPFLKILFIFIISTDSEDEIPQLGKHNATLVGFRIMESSHLLLIGTYLNIICFETVQTLASDFANFADFIFIECYLCTYLHVIIVKKFQNRSVIFKDWSLHCLILYLCFLTFVQIYFSSCNDEVTATKLPSSALFCHPDIFSGLDPTRRNRCVIT